MNWIPLYDLTDFEIYTNMYINVDNYYYKWEKSFVKIISKNANVKTIAVQGQDYTFYSTGEEIVIEVTDYVRASTSSGQISIGYGLNDYSYNFFIINGSRSADFIAKLPSEIPYNSNSTNPFYLNFIENMQTKRTDNNSPLDYTVTFNAYGGTYSWDWRTEIIMNKAPKYLYTVNTNFYTHLVEVPCSSNKVLVEWMSAHGQLKSWWFDVDRMIYGSDKELNLQTLEDGYYTLKNKRVNIAIKHKNADILTQSYLSDIVMSDEVYIYEGTSKIRVKIDNNAVEVTERRRDIQLIINKFAYDTI